MQKATAIGVLLSILTGIVWVMVGVADWPTWIGVVVSIAVGAYWAVGRSLVAGEAIGDRERRRQERRGRERNR